MVILLILYSYTRLTLRKQSSLINAIGCAIIDRFCMGIHMCIEVHSVFWGKGDNKEVRNTRKVNIFCENVKINDTY